MRSEKSISFINNPFFRILAPIILSLLIYFLILLVFDTLDQLEFDFFKAELLLCLIISYLVFETNRLLILLLDRILKGKTTLYKRIILQLTASALLILLIVSLSVSLYMSMLVELNTYVSELIVFNGLYIGFGWCYHAIFFSMVYLNMESDIQLKNEAAKKTAVELQMETSLKYLKPDFLNQSLETLMLLIKKDPNLAEGFLHNLADFYRGVLINTKLEIVNLQEELENASSYIALVNQITSNSIKFSVREDKKKSGCKILSGSLQLILEYIIKNAILSTQMPVIIELNVNNSQMEITGKKTDRLRLSKKGRDELDAFIETHLFYTGKNIQLSDVDGKFSAIISMVDPKRIEEL